MAKTFFKKHAGENPDLFDFCETDEKQNLQCIKIPDPENADAAKIYETVFLFLEMVNF